LFGGTGASIMPAGNDRKLGWLLVIAVLSALALMPLCLHAEAIFDGALNGLAVADASSRATVKVVRLDERDLAALQQQGYRFAGRVVVGAPTRGIPFVVRHLAPGAKFQVWTQSRQGGGEIITLDIEGAADFSAEIREGRPGVETAQQAEGTATVVITY
jgi:glutamate-1-semialdehyde aminotransferase